MKSKVKPISQLTQNFLNKFSILCTLVMSMFRSLNLLQVASSHSFTVLFILTLSGLQFFGTKTRLAFLLNSWLISHTKYVTVDHKVKQSVKGTQAVCFVSTSARQSSFTYFSLSKINCFCTVVLQLSYTELLVSPLREQECILTHQICHSRKNFI